jgi:two-component system nitrogen regulation response regulator GlnG
MNACGIVGESPAMLAVFGWVTRISQFSDLAVLFRGETGTGKGPARSRRAQAGSPPPARAPGRGELRGAAQATGRERAVRSPTGRFHGGGEHPPRSGARRRWRECSFLDEIGELELEVQGKLLRVLQEGRVMALGDEHEVPVNVRVVAATHRNLEEMVTRGAFREDLLHRLQILSVEVPPLRDRPDDLRPLVALFVEKYQSLSSAKRVAVGSDFLDALAQLELPGNVRQLENVVRRAVACKEDEAPLGLSDLSADLWRRLEARAAPTEMSASEGATAAGCVSAVVESDSSAERLLAAHDWDLSRTLAYLERRLVEVAVRHSKGNQTEAARLLGITPRSVYNKLRKHPDEPRRR